MEASPAIVRSLRLPARVSYAARVQNRSAVCRPHRKVPVVLRGRSLRARSASEAVGVAEPETPLPELDAPAQSESDAASAAAPAVWRPAANDAKIAAALSSAPPKRPSGYRAPHRLQAVSTLLEDELEPVDIGGRKQKAGMLFESASHHHRATSTDGAVQNSGSAGGVEWDSEELSGRRDPAGTSGSASQPNAPTLQPGAEDRIGAEQGAFFAGRLSEATEEELTWRGVRDSICFTLIVMAAGGPGGASQLLTDGVAAAGLALKQAHTHPQIIFFTSSLLPYLAFLYELWRCGRETRGMTLAFGSLLIFVVAGIPLESYTESEYGDLLSNVDSVHFAAQSLVSSTNLAILLAFQDASATALRVSGASEGVRGAAAAAAALARGSNAAQVAPAGIRADASVLSALLGTALAGAWALKQAGSQLVLHPASPEAVVGDSDLYPLLCVLLPTALGAGCLGLAAKADSSLTPSSAASSVPSSLPLSRVTLPQALWGATLLLGTAAVLAPWGGAEYIPEPSNALSVPTWSVHVLSIMEWSVAMAIVWQYGDIVRRPEWKGLAWAMLPLHGSGLCAVVFHLWYNNSSLDWLISLQAFLTLMGNTTCWWAARRIRAASSSAFSSSSLAVKADGSKA